MEGRDVHKKMRGSSFFNFVTRRLDRGQDCKILIYARDADTGCGKTTAAIDVCRLFDPEWNAFHRGTLDFSDYIRMYSKAPLRSAILLDEVESTADSRRFMNKENIGLSHIWARLRIRQVVTVCTLPSVTMLDKRLKEMAHVILIALNDPIGRAHPYYVRVNDINQKVAMIRFRNRHGQRESYTWPKMDTDPDFLHMKELKIISNNNLLQTLLEGEEVKQEDIKKHKPKIPVQEVDWGGVDKMIENGYNILEIYNKLNIDVSKSTWYRKVKENSEIV